MRLWLWGPGRKRRKRRESPAGLLESGAGWRFLWFLRLPPLLGVKSSSGKRRRRETDYVRARLPLSHQPAKEDPPHARCPRGQY